MELDASTPAKLAEDLTILVDQLEMDWDARKSCSTACATELAFSWTHSPQGEATSLYLYLSMAPRFAVQTCPLDVSKLVRRGAVASTVPGPDVLVFRNASLNDDETIGRV